MSVDARRPHGRSPWREAFELVTLRPSRGALPDIEVGQEARTKEWYVKSLSVPMNEGEGWKPWLERMGAMAKLALETLPQPADTLTEDLRASVKAIKK